MILALVALYVSGVAGIAFGLWGRRGYAAAESTLLAVLWPLAIPQMAGNVIDLAAEALLTAVGEPRQ